MKKIIACILTAGLVLSLSTATAFAAGNGQRRGRSCVNRGSYCQYVDEDNDGICDRYHSHASGNYVDQDGDGICDYCGGTRTCPADGTGRQCQRGNRNR